MYKYKCKHFGIFEESKILFYILKSERLENINTLKNSLKGKYSNCITDGWLS